MVAEIEGILEAAADRRGRHAAGARSGAQVRRRAGADLQVRRRRYPQPGAPGRSRKGVQNRLAGSRSRHRRARSQAQQHEARRRAAQRRAANGQSLHRRQARDLRRRQDGRPPRQQGRDRQDSAAGRHAVLGRWHAGANHAQSAGRSQPYERGPDSGNAPGLGRREAWASSAITPVFDGASEEEINNCAGESRLAASTARRSCTTAAPARRWSRKPRSATST